MKKGMKTVKSEGGKHSHTTSTLVSLRKLAVYSSVHDFQGNYEIRTQAFPLPRVNDSLKSSIHKEWLGWFVCFVFPKCNKEQIGKKFPSPNSYTHRLGGTVR